MWGTQLLDGSGGFGLQLELPAEDLRLGGCGFGLWDLAGVLVEDGEAGPGEYIVRLVGDEG